MQQEIKQLPGDDCMFNEAAVYFALLLGQLGDALCLVTWSLYHSIVKNLWSWQVTHSMLHHSLLLDSTDTQQVPEHQQLSKQITACFTVWMRLGLRVLLFMQGSMQSVGAETSE